MAEGAADGSIEPLSKEDFICLYENSLRCIDREDNLIHYRHTWALQVNVALVALLFVNERDWLPISPNALIIAVSVLGVVLTSTSFLAILAARQQLKHLCGRLEKAARAVNWRPVLACDQDDEPENSNNIITRKTGFPRPFGVQRGIWTVADFSSLIYCAVLVFFWTTLFIRNVG